MPGYRASRGMKGSCGTGYKVVLCKRLVMTGKTYLEKSLGTLKTLARMGNFLFHLLASFKHLAGRGLLQSSGVSSSFGQKAASSIEFGNPLMPDKLYKNIELEVRGCEPAVMKSYETFIRTSARHLNVTIEKIVQKKKPNHNRITLLKSVFVHRKHLVQYEVRTYYTWILLKHMTGSTADTFLEYVERMLPEGVALKVTKVSLEPLASHLNSKSMKQTVGIST